MSAGVWALVLVLALVPLLYELSGSFRFVVKMAFYNGWILLLAAFALPLCAVRGRSVENMKSAVGWGALGRLRRGLRVLWGSREGAGGH